MLLGLLGEEVLQQWRIHWHTQPVSLGPIASCMWFELTHHNVCDQTPTSGFKRYGQTHGLEFDGQVGKSYPESLALFGLPVTEPFRTRSMARYSRCNSLSAPDVWHLARATITPAAANVALSSALTQARAM